MVPASLREIHERVSLLQRRVQVARGDGCADLVLKNGRCINVFTGEILPGDVAICDGVVVGIGQYDGTVVEDLGGAFIAPGFIDGHLHVESTMLTPPALAAALVPHGTTGLVADPHELTNVLGMKALRYFIAAAEGLPLDLFLMLPSCVPATSLETSGAALAVEDMLPFLSEPRVLGLAEMMNYPGVTNGCPDVLAKVAAFAGRPRDGHAPLLSGRALNAYIAAGLQSDHETSLVEEGREKLRLGMHLFIREGTQAKNMAALLPLVTGATSRRCSFVTDDLHPHDIRREGHLDAVASQAIRRGLDPVQAVAMVSLNPALRFGLTDRGAVAPGYQADITVLSSLDPIRVTRVYKQGRQVARDGIMTVPVGPGPDTAGLVSMNVRPFGPEVLSIDAAGRNLRVIGLVQDQILTEQLRRPALIQNGRAVADPGRDILKIAVMDRHRGSGRAGLGFVQGFGLTKGALASSVAHDSHNIIVVGATDADMVLAAQSVAAMGGGLVVAAEGRTEARLALPVGGLMSTGTLEDTASGWEDVRYAALQLGCRLPEPFMHLSFLALPVIPALKLTDRGLVDVERFEIVSLFC